MSPEIERAMWAGDTDKLCELAACKCCCDEHSFDDCPARVWEGCRGQDTTACVEVKQWQAHYEKYHGMTEADFYGWS